MITIDLVVEASIIKRINHNRIYLLIVIWEMLVEIQLQLKQL